MRKNKYIVILSFIVFTFFFSIVNVEAASWGIISSKSSVNNGESFNVRITGGSVGGKFTISVSNGSASNSTIWKEDGSDASFTVTANGSGSVRVNVSATDCYDTSGGTVTGSDDVSVTIKNNNTTGDGSRSNSSNAKTGGSNAVKENSNLGDDNKLKSLSIDGHGLLPKFKSDVYEYTVEIDESVETINISAEANDNKAKINGIGEISLTTEDSLQINVEDENGKVQVYTIKIKYIDNNPIKVKKGKNTYTVVKRKSFIKEFDNYKFTTIKIDGQEIPALYNKVTKLTLVGLKNNKGKINLYRYDSKNNKYVRYIEYDFKNIKLILFDNKKLIPSDYKKYKEIINGYNTIVYKLRKSSKYSLIYGMNLKTDKKSLYLYDSKENTIQRYTTEALDDILKQNEQYYKICIGLCITIVILIIIIWIVIIKKDKKLKKNNKKVINDNKY